MRNSIILLLSVLLAWAVKADNDHLNIYDFSSVNQGTTIYYRITSAENHEVEVTYHWEEYEENMWVLRSYEGHVVIPATVTHNGVTYTVTGIGNTAFIASVGGVSSISLPNTILYIGENAFYSNTLLTRINIPNSCQTIATNAFNNCILLDTVYIGSGVTSVGSNAFLNAPLSVLYYNAANCTTHSNQFQSRIATLTIGDSVRVIPSGIFSNNNTLTTLVISDGVTTLGEGAFSGCTRLDSLYLGTGIDTLTGSYTDRVFYGCDSLRVIYYNIKKRTMSSNLFTGNVRAHVKKVIIGDSVSKVPNNMFYNFTGLRSVEISDHVTEIGTSSFANCTSIDSLACAAVVPPLLANSSFNNVPTDVPVWVPCLSIADYQSAPYWSNFINYQCHVEYDTIEAAICNGSAFDFYGTAYTQAGLYNDTVATMDTVHTLLLTVLPTYHFTSQAEICQGESYLFDGELLTASGLYHDSLLTVQGCDSVLSLALTVKPTFHTSLQASICEGNHYSFHGTDCTTSGTYSTVLAASNGCDSTVTLTLAVLANFNDTSSAAICQGQRYLFGNQELTAAGLYTRELQSLGGCDSNVSVLLTVHPTYHDTTRAVIFADESYAFAGNHLSTPGTYTQSMQSRHGCDSTLTVNLFVYGADTCFFSVFDTTTVTHDVFDTTFVTHDVFDTTFVTHDVFDTTFVTHDVFDTTFVTHDVFDTTYTNITLYDTLTTQVFDTTFVTQNVFDTTYTHITLYDTLTTQVFDTTYIEIPLHDTVIVTEFIHDTVYIEVYLHDTIIIHDTVYLDPNGVEEVPLGEDFRIGTDRGMIILYGAPNRQVRLLDALGRQLLVERNMAEVKHYRVPVTGVYYLQVDGLPARKVVVME